MGDAIASLPELADTRETKAELPSQVGKVICILNGAAGSKRAIKTKEQLAELFSGHGAKARVLLAGSGPNLPPWPAALSRTGMTWLSRPAGTAR